MARPSAGTDTVDNGFGNICHQVLGTIGVVIFLILALFTQQFMGLASVADINFGGWVGFLDFAILTSQALGFWGSWTE